MKRLQTMKFDQDLDGLVWGDDSVIAKPETFDGRIRIFPLPAEDGGLKKPAEWSDYWNKKHNSSFASMADYYQAFKKIKQEIQTDGQFKDKADELLHSLRHDMNHSLVTSTGVTVLKPLTGYCIINHGYYFHRKNPANMAQSGLYAYLPDRTMTSIAEMLGSDRHCNFFQALFGTKDGLGEICNTLEFISGMGSHDMEYWSTGRNTHGTSEQRVVNMRFKSDGYFAIYIIEPKFEGKIWGVKS